MCGIAGWIHWQKDIREYKAVLKKMNNSQIHRGPDESGEWYAKEAGLVHRRLIVIDPDGGKQPMVREYNGNKYVLIYNGELYNTSELRKILKSKGYSFNSHSDTEVLLLSFIEWGESCLIKLNGIYAFAVWDHKNKKVFLARDRIGVKPLFYAERGNGLIFSSELKGILAHEAVDSEVTYEGLAEIFALGPGRTPGHGIFKGVKELEPAHYIVYTKKGIRKKRYWSLESKYHEDNLSITIEKVRKFFIDAVKRQLVSDVPICTLLSGGLDSSAITAVASKVLSESSGKNIYTYSVDYDGNDRFFEKNKFQPDLDNKWVEIMSDYAKTRHHSVSLSNNSLVKALRAGVLARDLPGMADIDISLYLFCCKIKEKFTVAVSGECADEIFGGYPWFYQQQLLNADNFPWARKLENKFAIISPDILNKINPLEYVKHRYQEAVAEVPILPGEDKKNARMREMFYLNLTRWMPVLLDRKDRMSMYTGLEVRVPFCDHRLVEYVWNIPWDMKNYGDMRKGIFRAALKGILPEAVRTRKKNPYPKTFNPAYFNDVRKWLIEILNNKKAPIQDFINTKRVRALTDMGCDYDVPWFGQLMRLPQLFAYLIQTNYWLEAYDIKVI